MISDYEKSLHPVINLKFSHSDKTKLSDIIHHFYESKYIIIKNKKYKEYNFFNILIPIPKDIINTYNEKMWCIINWGCENDVYDFGQFLIEENSIKKTIIITDVHIPVTIYKYLLQNGYIIY